MGSVADKGVENEEAAKLLRPDSLGFTWKYWILASLASLSFAVLLVGKLFFAWQVDSWSILLLALVWLPFCIPFIQKLKFKDVEIELARRVKEVQKEVSSLVNHTESESDKAVLGNEIDPYKIRIEYESTEIDSKWNRVRVWISLPENFSPPVKKVVYIRHETFRQREKEVTTGPNFEDVFRCWGEFTIKAKIYLEGGKVLSRQKYLSL
jgi:hypothetical protein